MRGCNKVSHLQFTPPQLEFLDLTAFAYRNGASDLHFEPMANGLLVRARFDGILRELRTIEYQRAALSQEATKNLIGFDMSKFGVPQDRRYNHPFTNVDFRANLIPTMFGEKLCLRLLERGKIFSLEKYPLDPAPKMLLERLLGKGQGLILVSGPTGSGKSTLLYSALGSIDRKKRAVYTIEDPVEYELEGLIQVPISNKITFSDALRALMRQDPDVIMVGEIRDEKTAKAAMHAASTGHLVLSTIHANDTRDIVKRFADLGVSQNSLESVLLFASAQRLTAKLCSSCCVNDQESVGLLKELFRKKQQFVPKRARGCEQCNGTGYVGRKLLFEYMVPEESEGKRVIQRRSTLQEQAIVALGKGEICANEAYRNFAA